MHVAKEKNVPRAKSFTSIYDFYTDALYGSTFYKNTRKPSRNLSIFQATCGDTVRAKCDSNNSTNLNSTPYVTSEQYHFLNREPSCRSVVRSTSTIFCDLDDIAKRHSFHNLNEASSSNVNMLKIMKIPLNTNFSAKTDAIVQECATQIKPKIVPRDSKEINFKKIRREFPSNAALSSEIFLRDDIYNDKKKHYDREATDRQQKFWSFAKYRTEYTNPVSEGKKHKKKDHGKRTEDPCPCQLFSYACPCTEKKSLTELAKNSKSLTVADQITSTTKFLGDSHKNGESKHEKKSKISGTKENKLLNTEFFKEITEKYEVIPLQNEAVIPVPEHKHDEPASDMVPNRSNNTSNKGKIKLTKKRKKITCPKCRENVDIVLSTTDEEESLKIQNSSMSRLKEEPIKGAYDSINGYRQKSLISEDICSHQPRCELIPVCQILPTDHVYINNCIRKQSGGKSPKIIRITKACRHHPPCTVVPSCQRNNVLKNNCEFIPPCLHRPRCVNLPLCVPASKSFHFDEPLKDDEEAENVECPHVPRCKFYPECQFDPMGSTMEEHVNIVSQVQNTSEFLSDYQKHFSLNSKGTLNTMNSKVLPHANNVTAPVTCGCSKCNKSSQFDCTDCKCNSGCSGKEPDSNEAVIFIRDVGCQFRNKRSPQKESDLSKMSMSFDIVDNMKGNYFSTIRTLRYEDKFTCPVEEDDLSDLSVTSLEVDSHCPTHGEKSGRKHRDRTTGFTPKVNVSPYIAYTTHRVPMLSTKLYPKENNETLEMKSTGHAYNTFPFKSRKSGLKGKYKKIFKRRRSKASNQGLSHSTMKLYDQNSKYTC